ncbi:MAG TPA: hypothetical protein DD713_09570 [Nitrospiraceae bacterium]|nr:hypothetical protein [Nitrospiraceae bacterium]
MAGVIIDRVYMSTMDANNKEELYSLLEYVKELSAVDFAVYRQTTIGRRLETRLMRTGIPDYASYLDYLKGNPGELYALMDAITIKVSCFFRNPFVFEALREIVIPELLDTFKNDTLRIWCAGCAKGEEAYSVAILFKEIIDKEAFSPKVFIIGTDIDRAALEDAKKAAYKADSVLEVKKYYLDRYFDVKDGFYHLKEEITSLVTFAYHDVTTLTTPKEGVFSDYHLILCRNVLIYFEKEICRKVLNSLSGFILKNGYLVLGEAETFMPQLTKDYEGIMRGTKVFKRK